MKIFHLFNALTLVSAAVFTFAVMDLTTKSCFLSHRLGTECDERNGVFNYSYGEGFQNVIVGLYFIAMPIVSSYLLSKKNGPITVGFYMGQTLFLFFMAVFFAALAGNRYLYSSDTYWTQTLDDRSAVSLRAAIAGAALIAFFQGILFGVLVYNRDSLVTRESSHGGSSSEVAGFGSSGWEPVGASGAHPPEKDATVY